MSSSQAGDTVLDPFAGTGTTLIAAHQLGRNSIAIEIDPKNAKMIQKRLGDAREADHVEKYYQEYIYTENLSEVWGSKISANIPAESKAMHPFMDMPLVLPESGK